VCEYVLHDAHDKRFTSIKEKENHMFYLPKSDSPVWQIGPSSFANKTETFSFSRQNKLTRKHTSHILGTSQINIGMNKIE
jgi:hypothetical protein